MRKILGGIRWLAAGAALLAGIAGLVFDFFLRDGHVAAAPFFYALPVPVSAGALLVAAVLGRGRWRRRTAAIVALLALGWWFSQSYGWAWPQAGERKAIIWNMGRPPHPFQPLITLVRTEQPDVVALVETGSLGMNEVRAYERMLPGYRMAALPAGLSCLVRGQFLGASLTSLGNAGFAACFRVSFGGEPMKVFVPDIEAEPLVPRRHQLERLAALTRGGSRMIVMGDFNTPMESVWLEGMRGFCVNTMDGPHRGFRETWLYNLPLLSLDQVWLSRDLKPVFTSKRLTMASDHAPVVAVFDERP